MINTTALIYINIAYVVKPYIFLMESMSIWYLNSGLSLDGRQLTGVDIEDWDDGDVYNRHRNGQGPHDAIIQ